MAHNRIFLDKILQIKIVVYINIVQYFCRKAQKREKFNLFTCEGFSPPSYCRFRGGTQLIQKVQAVDLSYLRT